VAIILKSKKIKIIYHQFEMMIPNDLNKIDQFLLKRIIKRFKKVDLAIFPEENRKVYFRDMLLKYSDNQFFVLPNTNNNMVSENYSRQNDKIRIAHIGAVGSNHHITSYLKAIKELPKDKFEFLFVGMLNNDIRDMILKENFQNIIITGQIPHNDLKEIYLNIDIGVILYKDVSLHTRFCAPNKLYEFWSYGIPVVGDVLPGLISVFKEKEQGILIDMTQPNEICDAFLRLGALDEHKRNDILRIFNSTYRLDVYLDRIDEILSLSSDN
jgi:glycosyltransferase involved in cell wall biosynthesis